MRKKILFGSLLLVAIMGAAYASISSDKGGGCRRIPLTTSCGKVIMICAEDAVSIDYVMNTDSRNCR